MQKRKKLIVTLALFLVIIVSYLYVDYSTSHPDKPITFDSVLSLFSGSVVPTIVVMVILVALIYNWLEMLVDAIRRPQDSYRFGWKPIWIVLLLLAGQPTALVYYFSNRRGTPLLKKDKR